MTRPRLALGPGVQGRSVTWRGMERPDPAIPARNTPMDLSSLTRDERAMTDGVWITPNLAEQGRFLVLASTPRFRMRRDQMVARLTRQYRQWEAVPLDMRCAEQAAILFEELVLDVDGFTDKGQPVTKEAYLALASTARGEPALDLAFAAVDMATARREADAADTEGNSAGSSNGRPSGAGMQSSSSEPSTSAIPT